MKLKNLMKNVISAKCTVDVWNGSEKDTQTPDDHIGYMFRDIINDDLDQLHLNYLFLEKFKNTYVGMIYAGKDGVLHITAFTEKCQED